MNSINQNEDPPVDIHDYSYEIVDENVKNKEEQNYYKREYQKLEEAYKILKEKTDEQDKLLDQLRHDLHQCKDEIIKLKEVNDVQKKKIDDIDSSLSKNMPQQVSVSLLMLSIK